MKENVRALVNIMLGVQEEFRPVEAKLFHVSLRLSSFSELSKTQLVTTLRDALRSCGQLRLKFQELERLLHPKSRGKLLFLLDQLKQNSDVLVYASVLIGYPSGKEWKRHQYRLKRLSNELLLSHYTFRGKLTQMARRIGDYLLAVEYDLGELLQEALDLPDTIRGPSPSELSLLDLLPSKE